MPACSGGALPCASLFFDYCSSTEHRLCDRYVLVGAVLRWLAALPAGRGGVVCSVEHFDTSELPRISRARLGPAGSAWEPALMLSFLEKLLEWTLLHAAADGLYTLEYVPSLRAVTLTGAQGPRGA